MNSSHQTPNPPLQTATVAPATPVGGACRSFGPNKVYCFKMKRFKVMACTGCDDL